MSARFVLPALLLVGCASTQVQDAGDPGLLQAFDRFGGSFYSDLRDAGFENVPGRYLVLLDDPSAFEPTLGDHALDEVGPLLHHVPAFTAIMTLSQARALAADPSVLAVEPDYLAWASAKPTSSACATSSAQSTPTGVAAMGASASRATGLGVAVAVLDSGIDIDHPDLSLAGGADMTGARRGYDDDNGHGTHVAGTIAALDNTRGVIGVAPGTSLYAVKVLDRRGSGSYSTIAAGLDWAIANDMDVVNMSLGGSVDSTTLHSAVTSAWSAGIVQVVAAGNAGISATREVPAAYDGEVLTISAWGVGTSSFPSWSNYGIPPVDVAAPGVSVCSTTMGGSYGTMDGTSMATPHVAGAVAVYLQGHPGASFSTVEAAIEASVSTLPNTSLHTEDLAVLTGL